VAAAPSAPEGVDQAVRWCERAADDALVRLAWEEATRLYGAALDVGGQLGWDDRCRLLLGRARARFRSAELADSLQDSLEAARLARSAGRGDLVAEAALVLQAVGDPRLLAPVRDLCEESLAVPDLAPELRRGSWRRSPLRASTWIRTVSTRPARRRWHPRIPTSSLPPCAPASSPAQVPTASPTGWRWPTR